VVLPAVGDGGGGLVTFRRFLVISITFFQK
jgi:hypothetical protein